ncbi:MAG TPA: NAD(P)H-dependent oxidoreductase [Galbitalea sp.]|jgi:multimeric flavodoxin WrbA
MATNPNNNLTAVALVCTLKPSPTESSSELLASQLLAELDKLGVTGSSVRVVDFDVRPGVETDMGGGDEWPNIRAKILAADILVLATPTWMGHPSSIANQVLERLDAELGETDENGRPDVAGKVAIVGVVGNEDGAHQIVAELLQALNDVGFSVASQASTYWNGEAMAKVDYKDLPKTPDSVTSATHMAAVNAVHLAGLLAATPFPAES